MELGVQEPLHLKKRTEKVPNKVIERNANEEIRKP
jgi:hypothetical protein